MKKAVKARSDGIAFSLLDRTAHGDMRGAAMMISLMEPKNKDGSDEKNDWHGPSVAELLGVGAAVGREFGKFGNRCKRASAANAASSE